MDKKKQNNNSNSLGATKGKTVTSSASSTSTNNNTQIFAHGNSSSFPKTVLFWVDSNINPQNDDFQETLAQLKLVMNIIHVFNDGDECVKFFSKIENQNVFMVASGSVGQHILPRIHNIRQLVEVFIYCIDRSKYESLTKTYSKVRGVFTDIGILCQSLQRVSRQREENTIDITLLPKNSTSTRNLDQLDQSFLYTKLIKEILFELEYTQESVKELVTYSFNKYSDNAIELDNIKKFATTYNTKSPIYWYTCNTCIYKLLNWALREQEFDVIIRMAFFISDLHRHIERLHSEQIKSRQVPPVVYRGTNMSEEKLEELKQTQGGLISFNSFLSTSEEQNVAMKFIDKNTFGPVLFIITVDSINSSAPFANVDELSFYESEEKETLFSMQTIFRVNNIKYNDQDKVWHVHLKMTSDTDKELNTLIERMRIEIQGPTVLYRLGTLLIKVGQFRKAEEVFIKLLRSTSDELGTAQIHYQLGYIYDNLGDYDEALHYYNNALPVYIKQLSPDHQNIASCFNNIGLVYDNKKDYNNALLFYQKALAIYQKNPSDNDSNIANSYNSIGLIHNSCGKYLEALPFCKKALNIFEKSLPATHPLIATSHNNVGLVYVNLKKYPEAIASYQRAIEIAKRALPTNHPDLKVYKHNLENAQKAAKK